jgi:glucarate dehydratase
MNIIKKVETITVSVPLKMDLSHSNGSHPGRFVITIVKIESESGNVGYGEGGGGGFSLKPLIDNLTPLLIGEDADNIRRLKWKVSSPITSTYYNQLLPQAWFPIETALLDLKGKNYGLPFNNLLGGKYRDTIDTAAYFFTNSKDSDVETEIREASGLVSSGGFKVLKLKGGVFSPKHDADFVKMVSEVLPNIQIRIDPNGAWNLASSLYVAKKCLENSVNIEYFEDPVWSMEGMKSFHDRTSFALATNTVVVRADEIAPAFINHAVDVVLGDPHWWFGNMGFIDLSATLNNIGMELGMHSPGELGIGLAAMLHTASATPNISYAIDTHYMHLADDIVKNKFKFVNGELKVPTGNGLGVELDEDKIAKYSDLYNELGDYTYHTSTYRKDFIPTIPDRNYAKCSCHPEL